MKRITVILASAAFCLALAAPVLAGHGEKCSDDAQSCLNRFSQNREQGWLGVYLEPKESDGTYTVTGLHPKSPAEGAGFMKGDVLVALNGVKMNAEKEALKKAKGDWKAGQTVAYTVKRSGKEMDISVTLATMPEEVFASIVGQHLLENHVTVAQATAEKK